MAAEYCAVARIRQQLAEVPARYFKFIKTDCLGLQGLAKKYWPAVERLTRGRHPDGTAVYRCEPVDQLLAKRREPEMAARPPMRFSMLVGHPRTPSGLNFVVLGATW